MQIQFEPSENVTYRINFNKDLNNKSRWTQKSVCRLNKNISGAVEPRIK